MIHLTVDGHEIEVPEGTLILDAAKEVGADVPTFCYHHLMDPVAACRMCLVEVEKHPKLEPACAVTVSEGMVVHTDSPRVLTARKGVLEFLLLQHPLDCPICDKGGECDLQDHTMNHANFRSRYEDPKLHKAKAKPLSDLVVLDEERCIVCQRCVRFMEEIVEDPQLALRERGARSVVSTFPDRPFTSVFSGNTIEMCPVGALTSRPYRFRARPWDNTSAADVCTHCPVGCNMTAQARDGEMVRVLSRENLDVDGGWLCDRGRFGYRWVHSPRRFTHPLAHVGDDRAERPVSWEGALDTVRSAVQRPGARVGILGGGRLSAEAQAAAAQWVERLGTPWVDHRTGSARYATPPGPRAQIADLDRADRILLAGVNPIEDVPVLDLRIKRALRRGARLVVIGARRVMTHAESATYLSAPGELGEALAQAARAVRGESVLLEGLDPVATALREGERVVVLWSGEEGAQGLAALVEALDGRLLGTLVTGGAPTAQGAERAGLRGAKTAQEVLRAAADGALDVLVCLDEDLFEVTPDPDVAAQAFDRTPLTVTLATLPTEAAVRADLVLPIAANFEQSGHYVNLEGRTQANEALLPPPGEARPDWQVLAELADVAADPAHLFASYAAREAPQFDTASARAEAEAVPAAGADGAPGAGTYRALVQTIRFDASVRWEEGLRQRTPRPFVALHPQAIAAAGLTEGARGRLSGGGLSGSVEVEVRADETLPTDVVLVPRRVVGLPAERLHGRVVRVEPIPELVGAGAAAQHAPDAQRQKEA